MAKRRFTVRIILGIILLSIPLYATVNALTQQQAAPAAAGTSDGAQPVHSTPASGSPARNLSQDATARQGATKSQKAQPNPGNRSAINQQAPSKPIPKEAPVPAPAPKVAPVRAPAPKAAPAPAPVSSGEAPTGKQEGDRYELAKKIGAGVASFALALWAGFKTRKKETGGSRSPLSLPAVGVAVGVLVISGFVFLLLLRIGGGVTGPGPVPGSAQAIEGINQANGSLRTLVGQVSRANTELGSALQDLREIKTAAKAVDTVGVRNSKNGESTDALSRASSQASRDTLEAIGRVAKAVDSVGARIDALARQMRNGDSAGGSKAPSAGSSAVPPSALDHGGSGSGGGSSSWKGQPVPKIEHLLVGSLYEIGTEYQPFHPGDWLTADIDGLDQLVERARLVRKPLGLFVNGMPLGGAAPIYVMKYRTLSRIRFEVTHNNGPDSEATWNALLREPAARPRKVDVSVGVADCRAGCADITDPYPMTFAAIRPTSSLYSWIVVVGSVTLWLLVIRSSLLRDRPLSRYRHGDRGSPPWSLGRAQMMWWFFLLAASFAFLWMATGRVPVLPGSVLGLMTISASTAFIANVVDQIKRRQMNQRGPLEDELRHLEVTGYSQDLPGQKRRSEIVSRLEELPNNQERRGFLRDILSDDNGGVSLHRLQLATWTVAFGFVFGSQVYARQMMPDDSQLLTLMVISCGIYLGFKVVEKQA